MSTVIIDTREPDEYASSHVDVAINLPASAFIDGSLPTELSAIDPSDEIIVYCRSGMRSNTVKHILASHGFTNVTNGINEQHVRSQLGMS